MAVQFRDGRFSEEEFERILEMLHLNSPQLANNNNNLTANTSLATVIDDRALTPRFLNSSFENSLYQQLDSTVSPDELIIRQRGRKKFPTNISWSPIKRASPLKTPTKRATYRLSLLSPSPAKRNLNNSSPMVLRNSPRKRTLNELPTSTSTPPQKQMYGTPTKRLKFDEKSLNAGNQKTGLNILLNGLSKEQLISIISDLARNNPVIEDNIRKKMPLADIGPMENQLILLKKNISRSLPRSRLLSRTDAAAFARAQIHLSAFKRTIYDNCKILNDSQHFDALLDFIKIGWAYSKALPKFDIESHNNYQRDCFKLLANYTKIALKTGGANLGKERLENFKGQLESMLLDIKSDELLKCQDLLKNIFKSITDNQG